VEDNLVVVVVVDDVVEHRHVELERIAVASRIVVELPIMLEVVHCKRI